MEIVHFLDSWDFIDVDQKLLNINLIGSTLHHDSDAVLENWDSGEAHDNREEVSADGIGSSKFVVKIDDDSSDNDTNTHQHITKYVQESALNVDVVSTLVGLALFVAIVVMSVSVIVVMFVTMFMIMGMVMGLAAN